MAADAKEENTDDGGIGISNQRTQRRANGGTWNDCEFSDEKLVFRELRVYPTIEFEDFCNKSGCEKRLKG